MKNIQKLNEKYTIIKTVYGYRINYGTYTTKKEAMEQKQLLKQNKWIKNSKTRYPTKQQFPTYKIRKQNSQYTIYDTKTKKRYGSYDNKQYATLITQILPYHDKKPDIVQAQLQAQKEYYKYIKYEKKTKKYKIIINRKTVSRQNTLQYALQERDLILQRKDNEEETLCHLKTYPYNEPHPPKPTTHDNTTTKTTKNNKRYVIQKNTKDIKIKIGIYHDKEITRHIQEILTTNNWNPQIVQHIKTKTREIQQEKRNIKTKKHRYKIIHKNHTYYTTTDFHKAKYIRNQLEKHNWNSNIIKKEENYYITHEKEIIEKQIHVNNKDYFKNEKPRLQHHKIQKEEDETAQITEAQYRQMQQKLKIIK